MQKEYIGRGNIKNIKSILIALRVQKVLLVTGKESYSKSNAQSYLDPYLENLDTLRFSEFDINPNIKDINKGVGVLKRFKPDLVIAIGGGSVIDMGKTINILAAQYEKNIERLVKDKGLIINKGMPLVAIPTTAGTGSEATSFSVVYINRIKYSLVHKFILPDFVIVDSVLSYSVSHSLAASSAMDALSQSIESYWAIKSTDKSKMYAKQSILKILPNIRRAIKGDKTSIDIISIAANLSGKAINITTTTAAHAISYPITSFYGIPHGHSVALTLGSFFFINSDIESQEVVDKRGAKYLSSTMKDLFALFGKSNARECFQIWVEIMNDIGMESDFKKLGIVGNNVSKIIKNVNLERMDNNPVRVTRNMVRKIIES